MKESVLLVDDEEGIRKVLNISLTDRGYHVVTADCGREALNIFREIRPSLVLTDIKMPGMDGIELLKRIKTEAPDTEVIMITGHGDIDLAVQSLKYDASDFITKPINSDALEIALKRARDKVYCKKKLQEYTENLEHLVYEKTRKLVEQERLAAIGETVAGMAHAIKNIAGGLTGGMFVLEKGIELEKKNYLIDGWSMIKGNVTRIKDLSLDLLNYSKEREPQLQLCDPEYPARQVYELMHAKAEAMGITLTLVLDEGLPGVWLDPEGIHRCLLNLVTNAIDACMETGWYNRKGEVILRVLKIPGWAAAYQVEDNGCGMDQTVREQIFQKFFSTKGSRGTGIGLMIAKKIIDEHNGVIELETAKDKGTVVLVKLPERDNAPHSQVHQ